MKVLLAEDDPNVGHLLLTLLERWDMQTIHVSDGQEAWEILNRGSVDLIITDLVMPGLTGIELIQQLRQEDRYKHLPVLMISGKANPEDIVEVAQLGIQGFLAKPFNPTELKGKIQTILKTQRQRVRGQQIEQVWEGRTTLLGEVTGPQLILGEPIDSIEELRQPANRELIPYLVNVQEAVAQANAENSELNAGYIIEHDTMNIASYLKMKTVKEWIKLIFVSTHCRGNPPLIVRLFTVNRKDDLPVFLVYKSRDEIASTHQGGLEKKLTVRTVKQSHMRKELIQKLLDRYVVGKRKKPTSASQKEGPSAQKIYQRIKDDIETMTALPPLPQVYEKISSLSQDPNSKLPDWIKAIKVDATTCATILQQANSLSYGFKGEVTDIDRAVILLGKETIAGLVASETVRQAFTGVQEKGFILEDLWLHNVSVGFAAYILSFPLEEGPSGAQSNRSFEALGLSAEAVSILQEINLPKRLKLDYTKESPFVGGVMHDIGKVVMVHSYPGLFPVLLDELTRREWKVPMLVAEREVAGGLTHPVVGEILMRKWGQAEEICQVILHHHEADISAPFSFLIGVADVIGQALYPFPRGAEYPLAAALEGGSLGEVSAFLPEEFLDQPLLSVDELTALAKAISPRVKYLVEKMRLSAY